MAAMKKRLEELIWDSGRDYDNYVDEQHEQGMPAHDDFESWLADDLIAHGTILLPCKFQQKCYVIPTIENRLDDITEMTCIGFALSCDSYVANLVTAKNKLYQPSFGEFGKTVFLTREEAEKECEGK